MQFKSIGTILILLCTVVYCSAQQKKTKEILWQNPNDCSTKNFYTIQKSFQHDWHKKEKEMLRERKHSKANVQEDESKESAYYHFKRWENYMEPRVYPSGDITLPSNTWQHFQNYLNSNQQAQQMYLNNVNHTNNQKQKSNLTGSGGWVFMGPTGVPQGNEAGAGRINFIRFDPTNNNHIFVGAPDGGLWTSTNGGASWNTTTDQLSVIGVADIAIDSTNTQIRYIATGDDDAGDSYSIGVMKSTNGGLTWDTTALQWNASQGRKTYKIIINQNNPQIVLVCSNVGIYRTINGGASWTKVLSFDMRDMVFKPNDYSTIYAAGTSFYKSTDSGATWVNITAGVPSNPSRLAIGVTPANNKYVYLIASSSTMNNGLQGIYLSTDTGNTFTTQYTGLATPTTANLNLLGYDYDGLDGGGNAWYTMTIAVSPTNANELVVGGVNVWHSNTAGTSWVINSHWWGNHAPYVHADIHTLRYLPNSGNTFFVGCDGGVFQTTTNGASWNDLSNNLCIAQIYKIGLSANDSLLWITGHQDNGSNIHSSSGYARTIGGDGMDCFIDRTNDNVMYGEYYNGNLQRTDDGGMNWSAIQTGLTGNAPWVTAWYQDPFVANTIYCGYSKIFKSTDQGNNWNSLAALPVASNNLIVDFKVAPSNNQIIYVVRNNYIYKTINGGSSWTTLTNPNAGNALTAVDVKSNDANAVLITYSGYTNGNKIYKSINGGSTWTNISNGLPNLPVNCVRWYPNTTTDAMYVGCDVGVYYLDNSFATWQPYFTNMPNVAVRDVEIFLGTNVIRAATYGRGVWESPVYNPVAQPPVAQFYPSTSSICKGDVVSFTDQSLLTPISWKWNFPGGNPSTSTAQNPGNVTFNTAGVYTVTLVDSNANGLSNVCSQNITVAGKYNDTIIASINSGSYYVIGAYTFNSTGTHIVHFTTTAGCDSTITLLLTVITGINDLTLNNVHVSPNPTNDILTITTDNILSAKIVLTDLAGRILLKDEIKNSKSKTLDLSQLANGMYFLQLQNESGKTSVMKVVKD